MLWFKWILSLIGSIRLGPLLSALLDCFTPWLFVLLFLEGIYERVIISVHDSVPNQTFDFIIVGAGASGSVVANRLSVNYKVLLLEAGGTPHQSMNNPIVAFVSHGRFPVDWMYKTIPQSHSSRGLNGNQTAWPSGKVLGGSSVINGMIFIRGTVQGFDQMANFTGDNDWSLENVLKYYTKVEDYYGNFPGKEHGRGGNLKIGKGNEQPFIRNWLRAGEELGYKTRDPNSLGPLTEGFAPMDFYMTNGRRWDAYDGYINPALGRENLYVRKFAYVNKIILDAENRAVGVEYEQFGNTIIAKCSKEVILSAGAVQSAKILMLSGIGPEDHLREIGVEPRINLPVGENLMDKYGAIVGPFTISKELSFLRERDLTIGAVGSYLFQGTGPFSSTTAEGTCSFISQKAKARGEVGVPNVDIYVMAQSVDNRLESDFARSFNYNPAILDYFANTRGIDGFQQFVTIPKPVGTGNIRLRDANPRSMPLIDPKYLQNKQDMDTLVEGIKMAVKIVEETESFRSINGSLQNIPLPGCEGVPFRSNAYWECVGRSTTLTAYKYCSTAPIGRDTSDGVAVVDPKLRVFGAKGLRVIDGSVLREKYVSVNTVTCIMLGELGSDFVLQEWEAKGKGGGSGMVGVPEGHEEVLQEIIDEEVKRCQEHKSSVLSRVIGSTNGPQKFSCPV